MESLAVSSQVLIKLLNKKPGIKDNNIQIQKLRLECLKKVIEKFPITRCLYYLFVLFYISVFICFYLFIIKYL